MSKPRISSLHFSLHSGWMARSMSIQDAFLGSVNQPFTNCVRQLTDDASVNDSNEKHRHDVLEMLD